MVGGMGTGAWEGGEVGGRHTQVLIHIAGLLEVMYDDASQFGDRYRSGDVVAGRKKTCNGRNAKAWNSYLGA